MRGKHLVASLCVVLLIGGASAFAGDLDLVGSILPPRNQQVAVVSGTVTLAGSGDRLLVLLDRGDDGTSPDDTIDAVIRVGLQGRAPQGELRRLERATIEISSRRVVITAPDGPVALEFSIDSEGMLPLVGLPPERDFRQPLSRLVGAALVFELAVCRPRLKETSAQVLAHVAAGDSPYLPPAACHGEDCQSGGMGSTSCSQTCGGIGCSVSCGSGHFACCNCSLITGAHCFCYPIPR